MIALDTNVIVRIVTRDDPDQARAAVETLRDHRLFVAKSVLLETEWVLRHAYGLSRPAILEVFRRLLGLDGLALEDRYQVQRTLAWYQEGMDFADALHLASSPPEASFVTFDEPLYSTAEQSTAGAAKVALIRV